LWGILENNKFGQSGLTQMDMRISLSYEIYKLYLSSDGMSMKKLGGIFGMCRSTVNTLIKFAKVKIREEYDNIINNSDVEFLGDINNR
jgi:hypothetical protein